MSYGSLTLSAAYNYNKVEIENVDANPEELSGLVLADGSEVEQFDRTRLGTYTDAVPDSKSTFSANYRVDGWVMNARATRFGEWTVVRSTESLDTINEAYSNALKPLKAQIQQFHHDNAESKQMLISKAQVLLTHEDINEAIDKAETLKA